jgi:hypothetical protein
MAGGLPYFPTTLPAKTVVGNLAATPGEAGAIPIAAFSSQLADASTINFLPSGAGAVARTVQDKERDVISVFDFFSPAQIADVRTRAFTLDVSVPFLTGLTAVYTAGGGTLKLPAGTYGLSTVVFNWAAALSVNIVGDGESATILQKFGVSAAPVLDLSVDVGILDTYSKFADFSIVGNAKGSHGIRATRLARIETHNLKITACDTGFESVGCLVANHYKPDWNSNNIGFRSRKSGTIYANLVQFFGGGIRSNTTFGFDIGEANGVHWYGTDIEANGTTLNTATGNVVIRNTVSNEIGYANISMNGGWCENSLGSNFTVEAAGGLSLSVRDTVMAGNEAGRAMNVAAIQSLVLDNITAASAADVVTTAAVNSFIRGGVIFTITDTGTNRFRAGVTTGTQTIDLASSLWGSSFVLVGGTKVVLDSRVKATSKILVTSQADGGSPGWLRITTIGTGTFTCNSSSGTDTSTVAYQILNPA